jgi:hypothetical protein
MFEVHQLREGDARSADGFGCEIAHGVFVMSLP